MEKIKMEDLQSLHYIKEKELPAINHIFYDNSDPYRIKKRWELYGRPYNKEDYDIYSKCNLTNYDTIESDKNPNSTFRRDYNKKCSDKSINDNIKENNEISKKVKEIFNTSKIDFLQDYKKDKEIDYNNENNSRWEREKDDGLSRCYDKAHHDNDTDEVYKQHYLSTMVHDYTKKPLSKRDPILNNDLNKFGAIYRDKDELNKKKHSTYEHDYYAKNANNEPFERSVPADTRTHFKLEDYNCDITDPYATEVKDNYKPHPVNRVIGAPDNLKYHFITNPDYTEDPFKTSMKNDFPQYEKNKYHKEEPCEKQDKAQFELGHDINDNNTLYNDSYKMSNDTIKESYHNSKNLPKLNNMDNINLDSENQGYKDVTSTHRNDFKNNKEAKAKAFNDSKYVFDGIKEILTGIPLNLTWNDDRVKQSLMHKDYTVPKVDDKDKFKRINPGTYDTNPYLKTNNKLNENDDDDPKLSIFQSDFVNYPNKYKYNPRRPPNSKYDNNLFHNDIYDDENRPGYYRTSYKTDYQKINHPIKSTSYPVKNDFNTTLNEIFPKEVRNHSLKKQSVTHKNFNKKEMEPVKHANKYDVEKNYVDIIEYNYVDDPDNKKISIAHSSYIAPEITIDRAKMSHSLRNLI